jgi:hypothetical protein
MHEARTYQDPPITEGPIALQVQKLSAQPVMVSLRMALGMVAFGVSVVALGFALVFGEGSPGQVKAASQEAVSETAPSTSANAAIVIADESVATIATERGANPQIELRSPALIAAVRQATTTSARPLVASFPQAIETAEPNRKRRSAFYEDIPNGKSSKRP